MRLQWGPYATQLAEQVVVNDPLYVLETLARRPDGGLAAVWRDLITRFDTRPFTVACTRCHAPADGVCAYPGSVELIGFCEACVTISDRARPSPALRITGYEDALRHVATSFRRGHRIHMRRIVRRLLLAKGGPAQVSEAAMVLFLSDPTPGRHGSKEPGSDRAPRHRTDRTAGALPTRTFMS